MWTDPSHIDERLDSRDGELPTICGTGLEDYVGSAWGLGPHHAPFAGAPLDVRRERALMPDFVGFYRWHVPDPIVFEGDLRVTIQQIGYHALATEEALDAYALTNPPAGTGPRLGGRVHAQGIFERARRLLRDGLRLLPHSAACALARRGPGTGRHRAARPREPRSDGGVPRRLSLTPSCARAVAPASPRNVGKRSARPPR